LKPDEKKIWFPAKKYGWGWGPPKCWQGWMVLLAYFILLGAGAVLLLPKYLGLFLGYTAILVGALILIGFLKGEKPRWRWGKD
jgi:amino acid transporter